MTLAAPVVKLNDGHVIPQVGFGVFQVPEGEVRAAVGSALEAGYRAVDTAAFYGNEAGVGEAVAASGVAREDVHVTTKVWHSDNGYDTTLRAFERSMANLGLEYLDLYLIHWPAPATDKYVETWRALEKLQSEGRVRSIGVSNFHQPHLERLFAESSTVPAINQIELHPRLAQRALREFHALHGIVTQAWSPLARGRLLTEPTVVAVAERHGVSPAQVVLRWSVELGNVVLPKSVTPERIRTNLDLFGFALTPEDHAEIALLDTGGRTGPNPDTHGA